MNKVIIFNNPLINTKLATLKDKATNNKMFWKILHDISLLMIAEVFNDVRTIKKTIHTPLAKQDIDIINEEIILLPILRAGLGMLHAFSSILPKSKLGFAGFKREAKSLEIHKYHFTLPKITNRSLIVILDPMIASGNTILKSIEEIKNVVKTPLKIKVVGILGTKEAIKKIHQIYPNVQIYLAKNVEALNHHAYIVPGLGDAGDRLFGE